MKRILFITLIGFLSFIDLFTAVTLEINPNNVVYNYFYPSYIDPENPGAQPILFWLTAINEGNEDITNYEIRLGFQWRDILLVDNAIIKPQPGSIYYVFEVNETFSLSSRDIILAEDTGDFYIEEGFEFDELIDANDEFKDLVLELGYFPDGDYIFSVQLFDENGYEISQPAIFTFTIITPTSITLISPGNPVGPSITNIADSNPYFVWFSNMINYEFRLYELDREITDPEDIELQYEPYYEDFVYNNLVYSYPPQAPPLRDGNIYGWQILADVVTPMQTKEEKLKSNIHVFRISLQEGTDPLKQLLINFFQQINFEGIEEVLQMLKQGYSLNKITWMGEELGVEGLNDLLRQISAGDKEIKSVIIE